MNKKRTISLALAIVFIMSLFAVPAIANEPPALSETELTMLLGGELAKLEVLNAPAGANITWSTNDMRVARVSPNGYVVSVSQGNAVITANVGGTLLTCAVTVNTEDLLLTNDVFVMDTNMMPVFNQMGSIYQYAEDDPYYYWYGMNFGREQAYYNNLRTGVNIGGSTSWSQSTIRCYRSLDLVTWEPVGGPWAASGGHPADVARPNTFGWPTGTANNLAQNNTSWIARMGVGYNAITGQYVMVGQWQENSSHGTNRLFYAVADNPAGPFNLVNHEAAMTVGPDIPTNRNGVRVPHTGDMTMYFDRDAGEMYVLYSINGVTQGGANGGTWETNPERDQQYVARLNPANFLSVLSNYEVYDSKNDSLYLLEREGGREANCMFKYDGFYYYAASGLRGWNTSPSFYMGGATTPTGGVYDEAGNKIGTQYRNEVGLPDNMTAMRGSATNFSRTTQIVGFATANGPVTEQAPIGTMILQFGCRHAASGGFGIGSTQFAPLSFLDPETAPEPKASDFPKTPNHYDWHSNPLNPVNRALPAKWHELIAREQGFFPFLPVGYEEATGSSEWVRPEWPIPVFNNLSQFYFDIVNSEWSPGPNNNFLDNAQFENDRLAGGMNMFVNENDPDWRTSWRTTTAAGFTQWTYPTIQTYVNEPNGWTANHIEGQVSQINYGGNRNTTVGGRNYQLHAPGITNQLWYSAWAGNYAWYHGYTKRNPGVDPYITETYQVAEVPDGFYTLYGWVRSSGGQDEAYIYAGDLKYDINTPINTWTVVAIENFEVTGGQIKVGFYSDAAANQWAFFDDFALVPQKIDKTKLAELVADAALLNALDYTTASWNKLVAALDVAKAVLADDSARQANVNSSWYNLLKAIEGLAATTFVRATPTAWVKKLNGNTNELYITVTETYCNGKTIKTELMFSIKNNAEGFYQVGPYRVFVDTKGNDQIRQIYIVA